MMRKRKSSFKPCVELLEDRLCLSPPSGGGAIANPALAFVANGKSSQDLFITTADGSVTKQLTNDTLNDGHPVWSPEGTRIAFVRQQVAGQTVALGGIYSIKSDGTGLMLLYDLGTAGGVDLDGSSNNNLDWSPDGTKIAFAGHVSASDFQLLVLDVASGTVQNLTPIAQGVTRARGPSWSPDLDAVTPGYQGKIAFASFADLEYDIMLLDVTMGTDGIIRTGQVTNLTNTNASDDDETNPRWSPDGQFLVFYEDSSLLTKIRADGTGRQQLVTSSQTGGAFIQSTPAWSPDGQWIDFTSYRKVNAGTTTSDIFSIRPDGSGLTNVTRTDRRFEGQPAWNPKWVNDLGAASQAESNGAASTGDSLTLSQVDSLLLEALARLHAVGMDTSGSSSIDIRIADLSGSTLGIASGQTIYLNASVAGWGWFVDATPWEDFEFTTPFNQGEQNRMDLIFVLEHELGRLLGFEHTDAGWLNDTLVGDVRLVPVPELDWFFPGVP